MASTLTENDIGDSSQVAPLLDQVDAEIGSVTADGACDRAPTYGAVAARAGDIAVIIPPHVTAVPATPPVIAKAAGPAHCCDGGAGKAGLAKGNRLRPALACRNGDGPPQGHHRSEPACAQSVRPTRGGVCRRGGPQPNVARRTAKFQEWLPEIYGEREPSTKPISVQQRPATLANSPFTSPAGRARRRPGHGAAPRLRERARPARATRANRGKDVT